MKNTAIFIALFLAALTSCQRRQVLAPAELGMVTEKIKLSLDSLNSVMDSAAVSLSSTVTDTSAIRSRLKHILTVSSFVKETDYINSEGKLQLIEPALYYKYQGADLSGDAIFMNSIQKNQDYFCNYFAALEGYEGVADVHQVRNGPNSTGALEALFTPYDLLSRIIRPIVKSPYEIWVMEKDGVVIYDQDLTANGKNVFSNPYYETFTEFRKACHTISELDSGQVSYTFYLVGTKKPLLKKAWWKTINLHSNEWKIVWTQE